MRRYIIALVWCCLATTLPRRSAAQSDVMPMCYWLDSFNLRIHVSYYLLGNTLHDCKAKAGWPGYRAADIFRFKAAKPATGKTVNVKEYRFEESSLQLSGNDPSALAGQLNELTIAQTPKSEQQLSYDEQGYLVKHINLHNEGDPLRLNRDTATYAYEQLAGGGLRVIRHYNTYSLLNYKKPRKEWNFLYASIYCGEIKSGPLTLYNTYKQVYDFNASGQPVRIATYQKAWANACKNYDPTDDAILQYSYDHHGRLLTVRDSLPHTGRLRNYTTFTYNDGPITGVAILETPKMQRFLATIDSPYLSKVTATNRVWQNAKGAVPYKADSPVVQTENYVMVRDKVHNIRLRHRDNDHEQTILYFSTEDSLGTYRARYRIGASAADTESAIYDPRVPPILVTYKLGCVVREHYERPPGTWEPIARGHNDRTVAGGTGGWRIVRYGPYGSDEDYGEGGTFVAPDIQHRGSPSAYLQNFVLIDPAGNIKWIRDSDRVYAVSYY